MTNITYINRDINYYTLDFDFLDGNNLNVFFDTVTHLAKTKAKIRYQRFGDKFIFIQGISNTAGFITAKVRCIRLDLFPEIINMNTDDIKEIEGDEFEGIVETTHIIIDFRKKNVILAIEYNHNGAKIIDVIGYLQRIGISKSILNKIGFTPIVHNDLSRLRDRINRISEFSMKIHKNNLPALKKMDGNIFQTASASADHFENQYANVDLKIDYRAFSDTPQIKNSIFNLINYLSKNPGERHIFNYLNFKAEDEEKNNRLQTFDLLLDKIYSPIKVQKKKRQKTIVSEDIFEKMKNEIDKLKLS